MRRLILLVTFLFILCNFFAYSVYAQSNYVLPYPSSMPGSYFYKLHLIEEYFLKYWYFGDFGQFNYNLKESDKYLVEAKTLFEYKQYLLAYNSLKKSNKYFQNTFPYLLSAKDHGKNINDKTLLFKEAGKKHKEVLVKLKNEVPAEFNWTPEKEISQNLNLFDLIDESIKIREKYEKISI
ncbi:MAG: hypothetical protein A2152_03230 [Candidatus Levybacteria bacterium RBG_16_35_6]|nr:MAG: hypothetical protein A2152_03230 [Candidatus Levybacteria bacterium RBG_16_35_6]